MKYFINVISSKKLSIAVACNLSSEILSVSCGNGFDCLDIAHEDLFSIVHNLLNELDNNAVDKKELIKTDCARIYLALEGVVSDSQKDTVSRIMKSTYWDSSEIKFVSRGFSTLIGGLLNHNGILLRAGVRAFAYTLDENSNSIRVGGWGPYTGNDGGAYSIGCNALYQVFRSMDGREPSAIPFSKKLLELLGASNPQELIEWVMMARSDNLVNRISNLSKTVDMIFEIGEDETAKDILSNACDQMLYSLQTVMDRTKKMNINRVLLYGGVIQNSRYVSNYLNDKIRLIKQDIQIYKSYYTPIIGLTVYSLSDFLKNEIFSKSIFNTLRQNIEDYFSLHKDLFVAKYLDEDSSWLVEK